MAKEQNISTDLADLLATHNFDVNITDQQGKDTQPDEGKIFTFNFVTTSGRDYGTAVIVLSDDSELMLFYGDNLGRGMEPEDKDQWFSFMKELKDFSVRRNFHNFSPRNLSSLKNTMRTMSAVKEGLFESYYGNRRVSYMGEPTQARLVIRHNRMIGENDKRYRYVESLFIETVDQERFRLPFKNLSGGRAMLEHVRQGGRPYDTRGNHITETVNELNVLSRFRRAQQGRVFEGVTEELVSQANAYYESLQHNLKHISTQRGYGQYFESWNPTDIGAEEALVEDLRNLFVEQTVDTRIEAALTTLAKIQQQGNNMKEAQIFENWINNLSEGTWALPDTPESQEKLNKLMSAELIVGPDATNATELLYDVVGDDELFDILHRLADNDPRANIWDDSDVQARLAELGVQTPESTQAEPADVPQDTAPAQPAATPPVAEGDNMATFVEDAELAEMLKYAGVPVKESVLTDSTGSTLEHIKDTFRRDVKDFTQSGDMSDALYDALYDYYFDDMPYGTKKARDGDPHEWVADRFAQDIGLDEGFGGALAGGLAGAGLGSVVPALGTVAGGIAGAYAGHKIQQQGLSDPDKQYKSPEPKKPVSEGSCNMTMEGDYCPEHGLAECGGMYEDGGAVGMPYSMGEAQAPQDPINYNAAITGSYYEGKETDIQEGDALLARIKSLALLR